MNKVIHEFLKTGVEPYPDSIYGDGFRCSAYLKDGTYLPCVMLRSNAPIATLAMRRFEQEKKGKGIFSSNGYEQIVKTFVATGNRINDYDIARLEPSRYAIPLSLLKKIEGETTMAWTGFVLEMRDGKLLPFGTTFEVEFFNLPDQYTFDDAVAVHNHSYVSPMGKLQSLVQGMSSPPADYDAANVLRERPFFLCYYDA